MGQTRFFSAKIDDLASRENNLTTLHKARDIIVDNFPQCLIVPQIPHHKYGHPSVEVYGVVAALELLPARCETAIQRH